MLLLRMAGNLNLPFLIIRNNFMIVEIIKTIIKENVMKQSFTIWTIAVTQNRPDRLILYCKIYEFQHM